MRPRFVFRTEGSAGDGKDEAQFSTSFFNCYGPQLDSYRMVPKPKTDVEK